jgi:hypothetical protein
VEEQKPQELVPAVNIRYVGIGQLTVFFVSEDELRLIESGSPAAICLNLGIAFFSVGVGSLTSLLLSDPSKSLHKFVVKTCLRCDCPNTPARCSVCGCDRNGCSHW